jgi:homoserine kinase
VWGEQEAVVLEVRPWDVHGVAHVDVTVVYPDRAVETARLGRESVPDHLAAGDRVFVSKAVNVIVSIRRAA